MEEEVMIPRKDVLKAFANTYNLVDAGDLGLENSDGITNGWLLVDNWRGSEGS